MPNIKEAVRFVDDFQDLDPKTKDSCPGKVNGNKLVLIGKQLERREKGKGKVKHLIYVEEDTRNIWYKNSKCNAGVVMMGFSLTSLGMHPKSVPMEKYAEYFLDNKDPKWLERNDFKLES